MPDIEALRDQRVQQFQGLSDQARTGAIAALDELNLDEAGTRIGEAKRFKQIAEGVSEAFDAFMPNFLSFREAFNRLNEQLSSKGTEPISPDALLRYLRPEDSLTAQKPPAFHPGGPSEAIVPTEPEPSPPKPKEVLIFPSTEDLGVELPKQAAAIYDFIKANSEQDVPTTTPELEAHVESLGYTASRSSVQKVLKQLRGILPEADLKLKNLDEGTRRPAHYLLQHVQRDQENQQPALAEETPQSADQI